MQNVEFSRVVAVDGIGPTERVHMIEANESERAALARRFNLTSVERLNATIRVQKVTGGNAVRVRGLYAASIVQACVVTLEPVKSDLGAEFSIVFAPPPEAGEGPEIVITLEDEDPPEPLLGAGIDIGELVSEQLALAIDPYPRAPGADLAEAAAGGPGWTIGRGGEGPFAALAVLKRKPAPAGRPVRAPGPRDRKKHDF